MQVHRRKPQEMTKKRPVLAVFFGKIKGAPFAANTPPFIPERIKQNVY